MLCLKLLGGFGARCEDTPLPRLQQERLQSLLACLLLSPNGVIARRELAYRLWPDSTEAQSRTNLRTLLTRLRDALPEPDRYLILDTLTAGIRADAPIESDVATFESALRRAAAAKQENQAGVAIEAFQAAVAVYSGDLLPGCYDEWILPARERLRQAYLGALEQLIELLRARGDYRTAIEQARRLLRADPLHEPAYRELMRLQMAVGDRAGALRAYHACASILRDELGADPAPETDALHLEVLREERTPEPAVAPAAPVQPDLVGRDAPWSTLTAAWRRAAQAGPQFVLLSGEAGIGKTRLSEELMAWIERQEQPVAVARCYAGQTDVPYAPIVQWLAAPAIRQRLTQLETPWLVEVSRLATWLHVERPDMPAPGPLTEPWQRQRLFEALARALSGPGAFFVDDLQWCDRDTLDWLGYWLRSKLNAPLLLIGTARAEEIVEGHPITDLRLSLAQAGLGTEVPLTRLDLRQTVAVGATLLGRDLSAAEAEQLYRDAEGVPLFIVEIARAGLSGEARIARSDTPSDPGETGALPPVMRAVIEYRLARLSAPAREAVQTAAVIGREFSADVLALAMGKGQDDLVVALDELWQRQIIREQGADAYDFSHDKIRQVAFAGLSRARRRWIHRRVAEALVTIYATALDRVAGRIAAHFKAANLPALAIAYYGRAAMQASSVYAHDDAVLALENAISLLGALPDKVERCTSEVLLYEHLGDVRALLSQNDLARKAYATALTCLSDGDRIAQARIHRKIGQILASELSDYSIAAAEYEIAEALLDTENEGDPDPEWWEEWCQVQLEQVRLLYWGSHSDQMLQRITRIQPVIECRGTPVQRADLFGNLNRYLNLSNHFAPSDIALEYAYSALAIISPSARPEQRAPYQFVLGLTLVLHGDYVEAVSVLTAALEVAESIGDVTLQARCLAYLIVAFRRQGCSGDVEAWARRCLDVSERAGLPNYIGASRAALAWVAWRRGALAEAEQFGRSALDAWHTMNMPYPFSWQALWPLIGVALVQDRLADAISLTRRLCASDQQVLPPMLEEPLIAALTAWNTGQTAQAYDALRSALELAEQNNFS